MNKFFTRFCIVLVLMAAFGIQQSSASHLRGSDISYTCVGPNQYQIAITVYRDCSGINVPNSITVDIQSSCGNTTTTATLNTVNSGMEVSQLCPAATSTCNGGTFPGVRVYTYLATVTIQPNCGTYTFSYDDCCRNSVDNIVGGPGQSAEYMVRATLNSNNVICNNAPTFTSLPVPYFCINQAVNYSHGAFDVDGDSLVYTLIPPLNSSGGNIGYLGTYSATNPLPTASGFGFDPQTGQMTFTPTQAGTYVVDILVSEYRNGVLIGTTMRDIQIIIVNCTNAPPRVNNCLTLQNMTGGSLIDCNSVGVCPGQTLTFTIGARDPDGQPLTVTSNIATSIPGATLTTIPQGSPDSVLVTFSWTPSGLDTGFRYFTVQFADNGCPIPGIQLFTYDITVLDGTDAGPDRFYCTGGGPVQVNVFGGNFFSWTPTTGMVTATPDSGTVFFAPSTTTTYYVQSDLQGGCKNRDTITIFNVPTFTTSMSSPDDTICLNSSTTITVTGNPSNQGPFTYAWGPASGGVINPSSQTTEVRPRTNTIFNVTVTSASGCTVRDSFPIIIQGVGPKVTILSNTDYVCPGSTINLNTSVSALECGPTADPLNPCLPNSNFALSDLGTGTSTAGANVTPYVGFWMDGRVQYLYRASELQALGLTAGTITDIGFNVSTKRSTQPYNNFTIKMSCTTLNQLPTSFITAGFTTVMNPQSYTTFTGWNTHTLDVPYNWDGFTNLIIEICFDNSSYTQYDDVQYTATSFTNSVLWDNADLSTSSGCTALTSPVTGQNRPNTRFIMCTAPLSNYTFSWTPSLPNTPNPTVQVNSDVTYSVVVDDGTCQGDTSIDLHVDTSVLISAGPDVAICGTDTAQLSMTLLHPTVPYCIPTYALSSIGYAPIAPQGGTLPGPAGDDVVGGPYQLPFPFQFFCNNVTQYYISTNGFVTFSAAQGSGCCSGQSLPNPTAPNNLIALLWEDLNTNNGGNIDQFISGVAPNRVGIVRFNNVGYFGVTGSMNGQIQIYETTNVIELHLSSATPLNQTQTIGIENATGTAPAYSPAGYNASGFTINTPIAFRFTPQSAGNSVVGVQWSPSAGLSNDTATNPRAFPDTTTTYIVSTTFSNGCVNRDTVRVALGDFPYSVAVVPDTVCSGDTAQLSFNGAGVSYLWTPSETLSDSLSGNPVANPVATTTYYVTAFDSIGCRADDSVTVNVRVHPPITLGSDSTTCPTDSIILVPSGAPYVSYLWSTGETTPTISTANQIQNPQAYYVRVNDGFCFYDSDTVRVSEFVLNPIVVNPSGDTGVCVGESIVLQANSGYVSYLWSNGANTPSITVSTNGSYSYTATDENGCVLVARDTAVVTVVPRPVAEILFDDTVICEGQSSATLTVDTISGIVYRWNPGDIVNDTLVVSTVGRYYLTASNNGCINLDSVDISSTVPPVVDLGDDQSFCGCDTAIALSTTVGGNYIWSTGDTTSSLSVNATGYYTLTVTDFNDCTATDAVDIMIRCLTVDATVADPPTATVFIGRNATLDATTSYTGDISYTWSPSTQLDDSTKQQPYVSAAQNTTVYSVTVVDAEYGCIAFDSVRLAVVPPGVPPMPNAFTPNGDGANDVYGPYFPPSMQGIYTIDQMRIYNRWGQLMYSGNGYWDGTFNGVPQPANTYIYYITIQGPDQNNPNIIVDYNLTGSFTLLH